jgi:hypothetical protein
MAFGGWADRRHGIKQQDWDTLFNMADKYLLDLQVAERKFDQFPADVTPAPTVSAPGTTSADAKQ